MAALLAETDRLRERVHEAEQNYKLASKRILELLDERIKLAAYSEKREAGGREP
jgi:hypothetical protein